MNDTQLSEYVRAASSRAWSGPDQNPKVEAMLSKEQTMPFQKNHRKYPLAIVIAATVTGGALATVITHQAVARRAILETDDGTRYEVELLESPEGASGKFVADDGSEYHINMIEEGEGRTIMLDTTNAEPGTVSVSISDDPNSAVSRRAAPDGETETTTDNDAD